MKMFIAVVPVDRSRLPQIPELDAIVITDLYSLITCDRCNQDVWIGPRQLALRDANDYEVVCYECLFHSLMSGEMELADVFDLGGGHTREGTPRVTT